MSPITLSVEALALLRRRLTQGDRRVDDSNREAYRELARAGIMCPVSGRTTGPESHYRFTAKGWRRRGEFLDGSASPARSTREDIAMPTITLSAEAVALLRLHLERDGIRVDDSNREAHRELARAGIMYPVSGYSTGPESHYRFTAEGWRRRGIPQWLRLRLRSPSLIVRASSRAAVGIGSSVSGARSTASSWE